MSIVILIKIRYNNTVRHKGVSHSLQTVRENMRDNVRKVTGLCILLFLLAEAVPELIDQARVVTDGERIYVPNREEAENGGTEGLGTEVTGISDGNEKGKININTAGKDELMELTGIGEAKAESILRYREEHGGFQSIEELMQIEGIKEGVFNKIKDDITI